MQEPSIFTRIIKDELPSYKVYEDDRTLAFLDRYPVVRGQVVLVSKKQVPFVWDLDDEDYQALMTAAKKIARHLRGVLKTKYVALKIEGGEVPHAHVKFYPSDVITEKLPPQDTSVEPDDADFTELARQLSLQTQP